MAFPRGRDVADAVELRPLVCARVVRPDVVKPCKTVRASEPAGSHSQRVSHAAGHRDTNANIQIELVCPGDDCVVSSACGDIRTTFHSWDKNFPTRADALEGVEVEGHEVVEEEAINLASEYVEL